MRHPVIRFRIDFSQNAFVGPGKIDLLEAILCTGSLTGAARKLGMSYRRAWLLIDSLKSAFREPITVATVGGEGGGGVALTKFGEGLIESYRTLERDIAELAARRLARIAAAVRPLVTAKPKAARRSLARRAIRD